MSLDWYKGSEWSMERKGLHKLVLDIQFCSMEKPTFLSNCVIRVKEVEHLEQRSSKYLAADEIGEIQTLEMQTALTPVDCYVELLVQQMMLGETARCQIQTAKETAITFVISLENIVQSREFHTLSPNEVYELALQLKKNGVAMFKLHPKFAHNYFSRAAKCLISCKPFQNLNDSEHDFVGSKMEELLTQLQTNLAACLITEKRYEDVIYLTNFVDEALSDVSEKAIYRRALAYYNLKEYQLAQTMIEQRVQDYGEHKEFAKLHQQILQDWKTSKEEYKNIVQRMFN